MQAPDFYGVANNMHIFMLFTGIQHPKQCSSSLTSHENAIILDANMFVTWKWFFPSHVKNFESYKIGEFWWNETNFCYCISNPVEVNLNCIPTRVKNILPMVHQIHRCYIIYYLIISHLYIYVCVCVCVCSLFLFLLLMSPAIIEWTKFCFCHISSLDITQ